MHMSQFVVREAIIPNLKASAKEAVIREMIESLRGAGQFQANDAEDIIKAILKREQLGSTGIGNGIAIPHTRHAAVTKLIGTIAVSRTGVPFEALDQELVHVFVMLISPHDQPSQHLRALENVSRRLKDESFVKELRNAAVPQQVWDLVAVGSE